MANRVPRRPTLLEFLLELIHIFIDHSWLILQTVVVSAVLAVSLSLILSSTDDQARKWAYGSTSTVTVWIGTRLSGRTVGRKRRVR